MTNSIDYAGLAVECQKQIPDPALIPLEVATLKIEVSNLKLELDTIKKILVEKGLHHE